MRAPEARKGIEQLLLTGAADFPHRLSSRFKIATQGTEDLTHHAVSLSSSDRLTVLYGHSTVLRVVSQVLIDRALSGHPVVYLDGAHTFDALLIGRLARGRRQRPRKVLAMIHVARAFSARQLERLLSQCLADALERYQAGTAVITGLLETLSGDGLTDNEIKRLTDGMIESVRHLMAQGFSLLCPCPSIPGPMASAHRLFSLLRSMSDRCLIYEVQGKVVTEEVPLGATPAYAEPFEGISVGSPLPFQSAGQCATVHFMPP